MSALGGVWVRAGRTVEASWLKRLSRALEVMGPDGEEITCSPPVGMVQRWFRAGDSDADTGLVVTRDGYVIALDGRLDNGREVERALLASATTPWTRDKAGLVLGVYRTWGLAGFGRLVGDFAFALWDPDRHEIVLACDALGRRPLYYHQTAERLIWSSRARAIIDADRLSPAVDEDFVADFLANWPCASGPFKGVSPLQGGHALVAGPSGFRVSRYWSFKQREIRYSSDEEYEAHFLDLLRDAVACRIASDVPVFCELSGGVDSSSIACVADELIGTRLVTVSYVFDKAKSSDERSYIELVEEQLGRKGIHICEDEHPMLTPVPKAFQPDLPANGLLFLARYDELARQMRRQRARVLLSGIGGDQLFWSEPPEGLALTDHLASGHVLALLTACREWSQATRQPYLGTLGAAFSPLLPRRWRALVQEDNPVGEWLQSGFVKRTGMTERVLGMEDDIGCHPPSRSLQYRFLRQTMRTYALEPCQSEGYRDIRYPYLDRRIVEFALALPLEQKIRPRESRSIVRRALRRALPEGIAQRTTKEGPAEAFHRALVRSGPWLRELSRDPRVSSHGYVEHAALVTALQRARHGLTTNMVRLMKTLALEVWLRSLELGTSEPVDDELTTCQRDCAPSRTAAT